MTKASLPPTATTNGHDAASGRRKRTFPIDSHNRHYIARHYEAKRIESTRLKGYNGIFDDPEKWLTADVADDGEWQKVTEDEFNKYAPRLDPAGEADAEIRSAAVKVREEPPPDFGGESIKSPTASDSAFPKRAQKQNPKSSGNGAQNAEAGHDAAEQDQSQPLNTHQILIGETANLGEFWA